MGVNVYSFELRLLPHRNLEDHLFNETSPHYSMYQHYRITHILELDCVWR